ncbi:Alkaline phosphatase synthesis sensor protein phoR [uncultured Clostridium sp.]|uniref:sensor histidine kinase n=1 Tax=uncultured Clostridium sp. TaxID=59620 RepID=UPI000822B922|nr:HAMP domain-containing sensor histidine kinase [uncultured Clostridium sp.]SCJ95122.1 Alkaline phosphatase synthesis sensor protein phoR [uncultured Clostridium sp.]
MKKKSIVRKLIITFASITGGVLTLVGLILTVWISMSYTEERIETIDKQISIVEETVRGYLKQENDYTEVEKILTMASLASNTDGIIVDKLGYVYIVSNSKYNDMKYTKIQMPEDVQTKIDDVKRHGKAVTLFKKGQLLTYVKPMYSNGEIDGYIIMVPDSYYNSSKHIMWIIWLSIVSAMIISGLVINYFAKRLVVKPLGEINSAAKRLTQGQVNERVEVRSNDEIGQLAESFNSMAESLEKVDNTRKEFISNVSHELRSPITSIKGFVGGILDGVIPKDKETYYFKIVYEEINRLARLVNDLLDISAMEAGKFNLQKIDFDINGVISLCILNLEGKIKSKGLDVRAVFEEKRNYVIADRDRIIQVLTNLLENAIKYSDDNGQIEVTTYTKGDKIYISIFNSGENISKEDLSNIWDRFYKSDKSRTNKVSTGLGLPIVRLILSQHNEDVWVNNIDGKGVKFTFSLKRSD